MAKETKLVADATVEELRDFADISLGLEVAGNENRNVILGKIRQSHFDPDAEDAKIVIHTKPAPAQTGILEGAVEIRDGRKFVAMTLHASDGIGGDRPVPYRVNGVTMLIPRGKRSWVPEEYVEAVKNAQQTQYGFTERGITKLGEIPSYSFSIG